MMPYILGIAACLGVTTLALSRRHTHSRTQRSWRQRGRWPREGHGQTYFIRTTSQNW
jgi:hypothetical protein